MQDRPFTNWSGDCTGTGACVIAKMDGDKTVTANFTAADTTPPAAPRVTGTSPTFDATPSWSWTSGGGGMGKYRRKLDSDAWVYNITGLSFTPTTALSEGSHTLLVQERDEAGNWSASGSFTIVIDTIKPAAPLVSAVTPTNSTKPFWTWTAGGGGNGTFRRKLDLGSWVTTTTSSFRPAIVLTAGSHTLQVQERDAAGNWSDPGGKTIEIDVTAPAAPLVTGPTSTTNTRPTWTWTAGGGGNGTFRRKLDAGAWVTTTSLSFRPIALSLGSHTLQVQERDDAGNWSVSGSKAIEILP